MRYVILVIGTYLLAAAAIGDLRTRRIPNELAFALAIVGLIRLAVSGNPGMALADLIAAAEVFVIGFLLFWRGLWGGGDAKLLAATALLVGHRALPDFLLAMGLIGLAVTVATLAAARLKRRSGVAAPSALAAPARTTVPYGVAIATAGILVLFLQSPSQV